MTPAEKAAWRYLARVVLLWLLGLSAVGGVLGAMLTGDRQLAATLPFSVFIMVVLLKGRPKAKDFLPGAKWDGKDEREG